MDKIAHYRHVIKQVITDYVDFGAKGRQTEVDWLLAFDDEHDQYLWLKAGWTPQRRVYGVTLHVRLYNGKIWVEEDWTEDGIATELVNAGVPAEDIVLGFCVPQDRDMTDFAVA